MQYIIKQQDILFNIQAVKEQVGSAAIIGVLKGNGYGFGRDYMAQLLVENGVNMFAVTEIEDAEQLGSGILKGKDILLLRSTAIAREVERIVACKAIATIGSAQAARCFNAFCQAKGVIGRAHLKIDSGMGRYGFLASDTEAICKVLESCKSIQFEGVYTHFSSAFTNNQKTEQELDVFLKSVEQLKQRGFSFDLVHAANSSAAFNVPRTQLDAVRIGSAFTGRILGANAKKLKRVGFLEAQVVDIVEFPKGFSVGYNGTYTTKAPTTAAIVPVGHTDGFGMEAHFEPFSLGDALLLGASKLKAYLQKQGTALKINNKTYPVIGQIGLSHTAVDVSGSDVKAGDTAVLDFSPLYLNPNVKRLIID